MNEANYLTFFYVQLSLHNLTIDKLFDSFFDEGEHIHLKVIPAPPPPVPVQLEAYQAAISSLSKVLKNYLVKITPKFAPGGAE